MKRTAIEILIFCVLVIALQFGHDAWKKYDRAELVKKISSATGKIAVESADSLYSATATCFVIELNEKSFIVTNAHLFFDETKYISDLIITVEFENGKKFPCMLREISYKNDLALVLPKDTDKALPTPLPLGNSDELEFLDRVMTVSMQYGIPWVASEGLIEKPSTPRWLFPPGFLAKEFPSEHYILSNLPTCPGSSGSPLVNYRGEVVGINEGHMEATPTTLSIPSNDLIECFISLRP